MCVVLHWNPLPLMYFILFTLAALAVTAFVSLLFFVYRSRSESKLNGRRSRTVAIRTTSSRRRLLQKASFPIKFASQMITSGFARVYLAARRTLRSAANVVRWRTSQNPAFDHDKIINDSRWERFWREKVIPASEEAIKAGIPLEKFPVVRQSKMGTTVAYSMEFVRSMLDRKLDDSNVSLPKERYVLLLRGPKTESEEELEPRFKDVVTDMLQLKQVILASAFSTMSVETVQKRNGKVLMKRYRSCRSFC